MPQSLTAISREIFCNLDAGFCKTLAFKCHHVGLLSIGPTNSENAGFGHSHVDACRYFVFLTVPVWSVSQHVGNHNVHRKGIVKLVEH